MAYCQYNVINTGELPVKNYWRIKMNEELNNKENVNAVIEEEQAVQIKNEESQEEIKTDKEEVKPALASVDLITATTVVPNTKKSRKIKSSNKAKKPIYKKWWFLPAAAIVIIVAVIIATQAGGDKKGGSQTDTNYIGDTVVSSSVEFKVTNVDDTNSVGSGFLNETTALNFIVIELNIINKNNSEISLNSSNFKLKRGSSTYEPHSSGAYLDNGFWLILNVGSGIEKTITLVFETPTRSTSEDYILSISGSTFGSSKDILLKSSEVSSNDTANNGHNSSDESPIYYIGDIATSNSVKFKVDSVDDTMLISALILEEEYSVETENNFIIVKITISNNTNNEVYLTDASFDLESESNSYELHPAAGAFFDDGFYVLKIFEPGVSKTITLVFETPSKSTEEDYALTIYPDSLTDRKIVFLLINRDK